MTSDQKQPHIEVTERWIIIDIDGGYVDVAPEDADFYMVVAAAETDGGVRLENSYQMSVEQLRAAAVGPTLMREQLKAQVYISIEKALYPQVYVQ